MTAALVFEGHQISLPGLACYITLLHLCTYADICTAFPKNLFLLSKEKKEETCNLPIPIGTWPKQWNVPQFLKLRAQGIEMKQSGTPNLVRLVIRIPEVGNSFNTSSTGS